MKSAQHTTSEQAGPSLGEMGSWFQSLLHLHQRLSPRFARPEVHLHALLYLQAVLSDILAKMAGKLLNTSDKHGLTVCNACSRGPYGTKTACAMICVRLSARPCIRFL